MKNKLPFGFIFVLIAAVALIVSGQGIGDRNRAADSNGGKYSILGRVLLPDGRPAEGVKVLITSADGPGLSLITNSDGVFQTGNVPAGNYSLNVTTRNYQPESELLTIDRDAPSGRTFNVAMYLREEGQSRSDATPVNPLFKDVPKTALDKFKKGVDKLHANDARGAILYFIDATEEYPSFAAAYYERGIAYLKLNDLDKALESFVGAVQVKSDYLEAKYSVGYTQYLKNNFEVAAAIFDDVLKQKNTPEADLYLGISLIKLHYVDAAVPHFKAAVAARDDETMALAHRYLGGIYLQKKQNAEAAAELEKYLKLAPKTPDADKLKSTIADLKKSS